MPDKQPPDLGPAEANGDRLAAGSPSAPIFRPEPDVHLLDRLAVLYRHRRVALAVFVLTSAALIIRSYSDVRLYQAQARVLIEDERSTAIPGLTTTESYYWEDPEPYRQTQYRILKGRELTRRVVRRLELQNEPEFNGTAKPPATVFGTLRGTRAALVRPPRTDREPPPVPRHRQEAGLIDAFIGRVVIEPVVGSKLVDVYFRSTDPDLAAQATNALVEEYVAQNIEAKMQGTVGLLEWLDQELVKQQRKVEDSERALASYRDRENAMSLDERNNIVASQLAALNEALLEAQTTRIERETVYNQVRATSTKTSTDAIPAIGQNPQVQSIKARLADLQRQRAQLSERYGEKHPQMIELTASIADTERQLSGETARALQAVRSEYERALLEEQTISRNLEAAKADVLELNKKSVSYNVLEREAQSNRAVYETLLQRANELRVSTNSRTNNVRIVDRAEVPTSPISPSSRRDWLISIVLGLVAATSVAYGLEYMSDTIKTPEDITQHLRLPFLGLVPSVSGNKEPVLASAKAPQIFSESFRTLRTAMTTQSSGSEVRVTVVTSAQPLEGKTTTACNIAIALAYGGARVLLVDADLRRPNMHNLLHLEDNGGLTKVLKGEARVRDVIQRTIEPNLLAITAGEPPPNPSELLASRRMKTLLRNLSAGPFDWVVIDTPPILAVTDAVILAPMSSGVTFVVGSEMTRRRHAERALETLLASRARVMGAVLNRVDFDRNRYYHSRYYGNPASYYAAAG